MTDRDRILVSRQSAFSLLELLTVIAIIGILAVMTALAVSNVGEGQKLTTGGNMAVDLINNARQVARARNTKTMVIMTTSGGDAGRFLTSMVYDPVSGVWSQLDKWQQLPEGIVINQTNSSSFLLPITSQAVIPKRLNVTVSGAGTEFLPDGRPYNATNNLVIELESTKERLKSSGRVNFYKIIVNQATGIPIVRRP